MRPMDGNKRRQPASQPVEGRGAQCARAAALTDPASVPMTLAVEVRCLLDEVAGTWEHGPHRPRGRRGDPDRTGTAASCTVANA